MSELDHHVDLEKGIVYDTLLQIRQEGSGGSSKPDLVPVWTCEVNPKQGKVLMMFLKKFFNIEETSSLGHFKRIRKAGDCLQVLLCLYESEDQSSDISQLTSQFSPELSLHNLSILEVPRNKPHTKELNQLWSDEYWPIAWKGNPNHQFLNSVRFDMNEERKMIDTLLESVHKTSVELHTLHSFSGTLIAQETDQGLRVLTIQTYSGCNRNPQQHSAMKAISEIANQEISNRTLKQQHHDRGYLCTDLIVYTTHEPCVMCCMALVHSRIARITYIKTASESGGLESHFQLGDMDGLNWKFQIWKWLDKSESDRIDHINRNKYNCTSF
ncbi:TAD3 tRNA-specific adenosine deaminase subunit TAD3 [Candida maltosa Xu316]|uniref:CMP/dCMP-type deaminase domain-containing protein n=1 Tax=Candida maltosa (strain Xu316) TaxID=1245528 RepID=M3JS73_CANMX|nr:hypothetical protein G210_4174 [Candida maltosa Xu316]